MRLFPEAVYTGLHQEMSELAKGTDFTNPFRYTPHPLVKAASELILSEIDESETLSGIFAEGKMLGVLIVEDSTGQIGFLAGFSGNVGGRSRIDGFVPSIYDLTEPDGFYRTHEAEISAVSAQITDVSTLELIPARNEFERIKEQRDLEISELKRNKSEKLTSAKNENWRLSSQFLNGEIKRAKDKWKGIITEKEAELHSIEERIKSLRTRRAQMSDELQRWIFEQYIVYNADGEQASILEVFQKKGLIPPGGTGECAAPKLLNHAYLHKMKPLAMGEVWYGRSPSTAIRTHGHFYPSCTSKCGPLLAFMMKGLTITQEDTMPTSMGDHDFSIPHTGPIDIYGEKDDVYRKVMKAEIIYEDEAIIAVNKPSGTPSVPGLDGRTSIQEWLEKQYLDSPEREAGNKIEAVHRLDMDTSGIMIFAKTEAAAVDIRKQFEEHTVQKTYMARLCPADTHRYAAEIPELKDGDKGTITLPLSPDYDERPRQKVDSTQGKPSLTEYEVTSVNPDGTTDIIFHPHTGRTHQLRVHSAHILGLGRPILGDLLYGGCDIMPGNPKTDTGLKRLHLHALSITFRHPYTNHIITLSSTSIATA